MRSHWLARFFTMVIKRHEQPSTYSDVGRARSGARRTAPLWPGSRLGIISAVLLIGLTNFTTVTAQAEGGCFDDTDCDDGNPCTVDQCVPFFGGTCLNLLLPDGASCSDGDFCNGAETCLGGTCMPGTDPCDDNNACTLDGCVLGGSSCVHFPSPPCNDNNFCTTDSCAPATGCVFTPGSMQCNAACGGNPCNVGCNPGPCGAGCANATPPVMEITSPGTFSCVCNPTPIIGSAFDPDNCFDRYVLEYSSLPGGPWSLIASSTTPIVNGVLGVWNTAMVPHGNQFVRLTATDRAGYTAVFTIVVFVDQGFDSLAVRSPADGGIYGGVVCFDGTVSDHCSTRYTVDYTLDGAGMFAPVDAQIPVYLGGVTNDPIASWNTVATGASDAPYMVRVEAFDGCGNSKIDSRRVLVDNISPIAVIADPLNCHCREGLVHIFGTASDVNLAGWSLQYTGGDANGWVTISSGNTSVMNGLFASWDTSQLRPCCYTIRLVVTDQAVVNCSGGHQAEYYVSLDIGNCAATCDLDCDNDGDVDLDDYLDFMNDFTGP